ncbi:hypothetical protein D3C85_1098170 [compost metagenome]
MFSEIYDESFRNYLQEIVKLIQRYDVVTQKQAENIVKNNIDSFEDCFYDGSTALEAYNEYSDME